MSYAVSDRTGPGAPAPGGTDTGAAGLDVWAILGRVWARKWMLALFVVAGVAIALAALSTVTPRYTGEVRILIEGQAPDPTTPLARQDVREADQQKIESEIQVLLSRSLADAVVTALKLDTWEEFRPGGGGGLAGLLGLSRDKPSTRAAVIDAYYERLNVYQLGSSRVVAVDFWAEHPETATIVANAIADLYVTGQLDAQIEVTRRASSWLDQQVERLRAAVADSESRVEEYRRRSGLIEANGNLLKSEELSELNQQLILASAARAEAQARLDGARALLNSPDGIEAAPDVLESNLIQQLREQEVALTREITELSADLLPQHPDMIARQAELDDLRRAIGNEVGKIVRRLENEVSVAAARERTLRRSIERLKNEVGAARQREGELRALEREAAANRSLLESFLLRASEAGARGDRSIQRPEARIISRAETPESPSFPQKGPILMLAAMASLILGLLLILAMETIGPVPRRIEPAFDARPAVPPRDPGISPRPAAQVPGYAASPQPVYSPPAYARQAVAAPAYAAPHPRTPVTRMIARLPAAPPRTAHDQWLAEEGAAAIARFVMGHPARGRVRARIVRVAGGEPGGRDIAMLARLLAGQSLAVAAIGGSGLDRMPGFTDAMTGAVPLDYALRRDARSACTFAGWGTIPVSADADAVWAVLGSLAQRVDVVLVGDPAGVAYGLDPVLDALAGAALVIDSGRGLPRLPATDSAGIVRIG